MILISSPFFVSPPSSCTSDSALVSQLIIQFKSLVLCSLIASPITHCLSVLIAFRELTVAYIWVSLHPWRCSVSDTDRLPPPSSPTVFPPGPSSIYIGLGFVKMSQLHQLGPLPAVTLLLCREYGCAYESG